MSRKANIAKTIIGAVAVFAASVTTSFASADGHGRSLPADVLARLDTPAIFVGGLLVSNVVPPGTGAVLITQVAAYEHLLALPDVSDSAEPGIDPIETGAIVAGVFNSFAIPIHSFPVAKRWQRVMRGISECASAGACTAKNDLLDQIAHAAEGKALPEKVDIVNAMVNSAIRYRGDQSLYGKLDYWATPAEVLSRASGDCEDFVVLKMTALMRVGVPAKSLSLVVLRDNRRGVFHAVLAVATSSGSFILDNAREKVVKDANLPQYQPLYSLSEARAWIHGTRAKDNPVVAQGGDFTSIAPGEGVAGSSDRDEPLSSPDLSLRPAFPALD